MNLRTVKISGAKKISRLLWSLTGRKKIIGNKIPVLSYHRVLPDFSEDEAPMYSVLPQQFSEQMKYLAEHGFVSLSLDEYDEILEGRREAPERGVVVTFDDGYADIYSIAWPIAQRYGIKLNVFICTGFVQSDNAFIYPRMPFHAFNHRTTFPEWWRSLQWSEIQKMQEQGVGIGFHGHTHRKMARLSVAAMNWEFTEGLSICREKLGADICYFAFPHGTADSYNNDAIVLAHQHGIQRIFTTRLRRTPVDLYTELISRLVIHQEDDLNTFELKLYGAYDWLGDIRHFCQQHQLTSNAEAEELKLSQTTPAEKIVGGGR